MVPGKESWWSRRGLLVLIALNVLALSVFFALIPRAWGVVLPFLGVLIGIAWGHFVPFLLAGLEEVADTGKWVRFDASYWIAPAAAFLASIVVFIGLLISVPGVLQQVTGLGFVMAVALGRTAKEGFRDLLKVQALLVYRRDVRRWRELNGTPAKG